jgi:CheY-like chemotaxis protein
MTGWIVALLLAILAAVFAMLWRRALRQPPAPPPPAKEDTSVASYIGGMAHDFNNLLGIVIGNLDIAVGQNREESLREPLRAALDTALRAAQINRRLHAVMRPQPLQARRFALDAMMPKLVDELRATFGDQLEIKTDLTASATISADPDQLLAVLGELARNTIEAMPEGGAITISTRQETDDTIRLAVTDHGPGMPPEVAARAFEPFFSTRKGVRGAGLGLCLVRSFAERSRGRVTLETAPRQGTTVALHLPVAPVMRESAAHSGGLTVLIVEDSGPMRLLAQTYLTEFGYRTEVADSAEAALMLLRDGRPIDLLFTDLILPGTLDGRDLARAAMRLRPGMRCLVTTGGDEPVVDGLPVLPKPYRKEDLAQAVRDCFGQAV